MKKSTLILKIFGIVLLLMKIISPIKALAQNAEGIIVSPPFYNKTISIGETASQIFNVTNQRASTETFFVQSREVGIDENGNFFTPDGFKIDPTSKFEKNGWLTISEKNFTLIPNESKAITVTISLPNDLITNGYYIELAFTTVPVNSTAKVNLAPEVVIPIAINYNGETQNIRKIGIFKFSYEGKPDEKTKSPITKTIEKIIRVLTFSSDTKITQYPPIIFSSLISNDGNTNLIPTGQIFISKDPDFKNNISTLDLNPKNLMVFAETNRTFLSSWNDSFIIQNDNGDIKYQWDKLDKIRAGKYYAQLTVAWEDQNGVAFTSDVISFSIIPWKEISALSLFSIGILLSIIKLVNIIIAKRRNL